MLNHRYVSENHFQMIPIWYADAVVTQNRRDGRHFHNQLIPAPWSNEGRMCYNGPVGMTLCQ